MFVQGRTVDQVKWTIFLLHSQTRSIEIYIFFSKYIDHLFIAISNKSVEIYIFSRNMWTIFLLQFQTRSVDIYFFKLCEPFFCYFKPGLMKDIFFFLQNMWRMREQLLQISAINSFMVDTEPDARPVKLWKLLSSKYSSA